MSKKCKTNEHAGIMQVGGLSKQLALDFAKTRSYQSQLGCYVFIMKTEEHSMKILKELISKHKFPGNKIYNLGKTGNSTIHVPGKIICNKRTDQVQCVTSSYSKLTELCQKSYWQNSAISTKHSDFI